MFQLKRHLFSCMSAEHVQIIQCSRKKITAQASCLSENDRRTFTLMSLQFNVLATIQDTAFIDAQWFHFYASHSVNLTISYMSFLSQMATWREFMLLNPDFSIHDSSV